MTRWQQDGPEQHVTVFVREENRRQGVATALINEVIAIADGRS